MSPARVLAASNNASKRAELAAILAESHFMVVTPSDLALALQPEETGSTFAENAILKAEAFRDASGCITVADDSGLEVEDLHGAPGIYSARYGGPGSTDFDRNVLVLEGLRALPGSSRLARFRAVIAVAVPGRPTRTFEGRVEGTISPEPRGQYGFGYDPIFYHPPSGCTFGELTGAQKSRISHRALALVGAVRYLRDIEDGRILETEHRGG